MKTALVTGSSSGIGLAIVKALSARGYSDFAGVRTLPDRERDPAMLQMLGF